MKQSYIHKTENVRLFVCYSFLTHGHSFKRICMKFDKLHRYTLRMVTWGLASAARARFCHCQSSRRILKKTNEKSTCQNNSCVSERQSD